MLTIQAEKNIKLISEVRFYENKTYITLDKCEMDFIKRKLLESEENRNIVRVLRGEGRPDIIEKYIYNGPVFFLYGLKSLHATVEANKLTEFFNPVANLDKEEMLKFLPTLIDELKIQHKKDSSIKLPNDLEAKFRQFICNATDILFIRDFFASILHTSGRNKDFNTAKPWISCTYGAKKYEVAEKFARCRETINDYILIDYWVDRNRKNMVPTYYLTRDIICRLKSFSIDWYPDYNKEIMVRYGLFPQNIVGYYVYTNRKLHYYVINPYYLHKWRNNSSFNIGDSVFIDQSEIKFENTDDLYKRIYFAGPNGQIGIFQD